MAKGGKLTKLKSVLKKWNSLGRRSNVSAVSDDCCDAASPASAAAASASDLHPVYVGKSRRRYLIGSAVLRHPLFRELVERSACPTSPGGGAPDEAALTVACEVVLFEHLLWMLENADDDPQPESVDELVEFYAC
ncbi:hypothetical protein BT93_L1335 [Corymbia citriodora subsp. variegata]|uniref:SAUR family protein n=1 Tax=Corymbia citriodora subsp. variegata TaxID=360336 RepID=A0A8T0CMU9_CORYI|nr:hypothetical protein BT93_L1335 [Corymbia citriodora subsp. variegata]